MCEPNNVRCDTNASLKYHLVVEYELFRMLRFFSWKIKLFLSMYTILSALKHTGLEYFYEAVFV